MNIQTEKIELAKLILETDNPQLLKAVKHLIKSSSEIDIWDELTPIQQNEIKQGLKEIQEGKTSDFEEFLSEYLI